MSTRAIYGFTDERNPKPLWVYIHYDGYPEGAATYFENAKKMAWDLPRFEADEFAAAFVAANKKGTGAVRLSEGPETHGDLEYAYLMTQTADKKLHVRAFESPGQKKGDYGREIFSGSLEEFTREAKSLG